MEHPDFARLDATYVLEMYLNQPRWLRCYFYFIIKSKMIMVYNKIIIIFIYAHSLTNLVLVNKKVFKKNMKTFILT